MDNRNLLTVKTAEWEALLLTTEERANRRDNLFFFYQLHPEYSAEIKRAIIAMERGINET